MIILDASALLGIIFVDQRTVYTTAVLDFIQHHRVFAPDLLRVEVAHVLRKKETRDSWKPIDVDLALQAIDELEFFYQSLDNSAADLVLLQRRHSLSAYDAVYLALALRLGMPLATTDDSLVVAAQREGLYWQPPL
ncbi:MAG: type II toxin-antitoxin system VapC family toxin [Holosporales bacterium]|jgi:predicted nucleic acid-binding protein